MNVVSKENGKNVYLLIIQWNPGIFLQRNCKRSPNLNVQVKKKV